MRMTVLRLASLLVMTILIAACQTTANVSLEKQATRAEVHYRLGIDALTKGNLPKAFNELLKAEQLAPTRTDILDALGYAWRLRGDLGKAERYYRRALRYKPSAATYNNFGNLLLQMKRPKEAEKYLRLALKDPLYRNPDKAYINLGDALLDQGKFTEAIAAYRQATMLNPRQDISLFREAAAYIRYNRDHFAEALYETLLRQRPGHRQAMQLLLNLLKKNGNLSKARRLLKKFRDVTSVPMDRAWAEEELSKLSM